MANENLLGLSIKLEEIPCPALTKDDFIFSTNPIAKDLEQAKIKRKILVAYSKDPKKCVEIRERLGMSPCLLIWLDQGLYKMKDCRILEFEEFFLDVIVKRLESNTVLPWLWSSI
jgi:hypothetical protein